MVMRPFVDGATMKHYVTHKFINSRNANSVHKSDPRHSPSRDIPAKYVKELHIAYHSALHQKKNIIRLFWKKNRPIRLFLYGNQIVLT